MYCLEKTKNLLKENRNTDVLRVTTEPPQKKEPKI